MVSVKSCVQFRNISETKVFTVKEWIIGNWLTQFSLHSNKDLQVYGDAPGKFVTSDPDLKR